MSTTNRASGETGFVPAMTPADAARRGLAPGLAGLLMTPEEFDAIDHEDCEPGYRYELIQGVVTVNPAPGDAHASPNEVLGYLLLRYQEDHPHGESLDDTMQERYIRVPNGRRQADRSIWTGLGRLADSAEDVPTIVVEFVSASRRDWLRDYVEKRDEYLGIGVKEYWVIDRFRRTMTVFRSSNSGPAESVLAESEVYSTPLLPGFELPLARILAAADRKASIRRKKSNEQ